MSTHINFETPTKAEIEKSIQKAHQMRSEYLARRVKAGLSNLRGLFARRKTADNAAA